MKKENFDLDWRFSLDGAEEVSVNLPHDFSIGKQRRADSRMGEAGGFYQGGNGTYRKALHLPGEMAETCVQLEVEGAYMNAEVFVNGNLAAFHPYGYTSFHADLTRWIKFGQENEIKIHTRNDALPNSRWYSGSGLYRHVWLRTGRESYFLPWGVYATTPVAGGENAVVRVETDVAGGGLLRHTLTDAAGKAVASAECQTSPGKAAVELAVSKATLWSPETPVLYTLKSELVSESGVADTVTTFVGIRSFALDKEKGLLLNGKPIKLKGGCVHHDCGILGAASWDCAEERKVQAHKDAGYNAIRCAHNPPAPAFLDACDRLGVIVVDEAFDCWRMGKTSYDYHLYFEAYWRSDISSMVLRDRNHPCIAFWSTGNEIPERFGDSGGYELAAELADAVRELDSTRFVTNAMNGYWFEWTDEMNEKALPFAKPLDVSGFNYHYRRYGAILERNPERFIHSTETLPSEAFENWQAVLASPHVIGDFVWTSLDYIGEAGIGHAYLPDGDPRTHGLPFPWRLANCGDLDIFCRPRPQSFYRQILWGHRTLPYIAVHRPNSLGLKAAFNAWGWGDVRHSWSWPGCEGFKTHIDVYSACDEVELFLNGVSLGRKPAGAAARNTASFETEYAPGEIRAVAYQNGIPAGEDTAETCGKPHGIRLEADRTGMEAKWGNLAYVTATVVDSKGKTVPYAVNKLTFTVSGAGNILALGTDDPCPEEEGSGNCRKAYEGTVLAVLNSIEHDGTILLSASADGLTSVEITIQSIV